MSQAIEAGRSQIPAPPSPTEPQASPVARVEEAAREVRRNLLRLVRSLPESDFPHPALDGKLLRPLAAYLALPKGLRGELDDRFWWGALAVEMVHEASLLHDDILDEAPERRGKPTLSSTAGVGPALVLGDHLLTAAYRAAAGTGSTEFLQIFIRSVERTVAGEIAQEQAQGRILSEEAYLRNITGKSGELFRAVFSLPPCLLGAGSVEAVGAIGAHLGCLYQMVDDFLDYCPDADRGKPPLQDFRQRKWTWPLGLVEAPGFESGESEILQRLFGRPPGEAMAPMELGIRRMESEVAGLLSGLRAEGLETDLLGALLGGWLRNLELATVREVVRFSPSAASGVETTRVRVGTVSHIQTSPPDGPPPEREAVKYLKVAASHLGEPGARLAYFTEHARTFRFSARLFPREALDKTAGVYAFCRFTDDLVDEAAGVDPSVLEGRLDAWLLLAAEAYETGRSRIPILDEVLGTARVHQVPFHYVEELVEGVRMDVRPRTYGTVEELRSYSYRVASVVGGWLTELFGVHDPRVLDRAFALGHAMQLTNILRDVGEDLRAGRLYLPLDRMARHGVDRDLLEAKVREGSPQIPGYRNLMQELLARADADYDRAFLAIPALPSFFQGPVAVAARAYQGIHDEIRKNGFDNLSLRARTSTLRKLRLAGGGLIELRLLARRQGKFRKDLAGEILLPDEGREVTA